MKSTLNTHFFSHPVSILIPASPFPPVKEKSKARYLTLTSIALLSPRTWTGKYICIASLTWGLFLFALLVDYVHQLMQLDKDEIDAAHWVQAYKVWMGNLRF